MKAVLVTGASTPIGAAIVRALLADADGPARVLAVGIEPDAAGRLPLDEARLRYERLDLTRQRSCRELMHGHARELEVEAVVHSALHRSARDSGRRVHRLNVESTRTLLRLCESHPTVRSFIYRSFGEVYLHDAEQPSLISEETPLDLSPGTPQRVRDRVEADLTVCTRMGMSALRIVVLRFAEILLPDSGSQLWDWLQSAVCLRPLGFDPMVNLLTVDDAVAAVRRALLTDAQGVFNIPGKDTLPLSRVVELFGRRDVPLPGPVLGPLYRLRELATDLEFRYDLNRGRLHFADVLDGTRAARELGYEPAHAIDFRANGAGQRAR